VKSWVVTLALALALAVIPAGATAHPEPYVPPSAADDRDPADLPRNRLAVGLFFQDVVALTPAAGGFIAPLEGAVIGVAASYQRRTSYGGGWFLDLGGGYGVGEEAVQVFQPFAFKDKTSIRAAFGRGGVGYEVRLTRRVVAHGGSGLFFSRTRATFDNGSSTVEGETFNAFGLDAALGGRVGMGGNTGLYAEHYAAYGWGSGKGADAKYSASVKVGGYRGGLTLGF
jgi:hypothetical protein